jgi:hypothetical protein
MSRRDLVITLMPSEVQVRRVELPPMTPDDARLAVERNIGRYFLDASEPMTIGMERVRGSRTAWIVAAAPTRVVDAAWKAAGDAPVSRVVPAHAA